MKKLFKAIKNVVWKTTIYAVIPLALAIIFFFFLIDSYVGWLASIGQATSFNSRGIELVEAIILLIVGVALAYCIILRLKPRWTLPGPPNVKIIFISFFLTAVFLGMYDDMAWYTRFILLLPVTAAISVAWIFLRRRLMERFQK